MAVESIKDGVVASIVYTLTVDGTIVEDVDDDNAVEYLHGEENIVPGLEKALTGKKVGDSFEVTVKPEQAYGEYDDEMLENIPIEDFESLEDLVPGTEIELMAEDGDWMEAIVKEVTDKFVVLDFNPQLAGKTLNYKVKVVAVRAATQDELDMGFPESMLEEVYIEDEEGDHEGHFHN